MNSQQANSSAALGLWPDGPDSHGHEPRLYRRVVVPIDYTGTTETAIDHGAAIAAQAGAELHLLTVTPSYSTPDVARRRLEVIAEKHGSLASVRATDSGDPATAIIEEAAHPGTLVCMQTHARKPVTEMALGSVSEAVMRASRNPVLLVGPNCGPAPERYQSMILPLDGTPFAEQILPVAVSWTKRLALTPWLFQVLGAHVPFELGDDITDSAYVQRVARGLMREGIEAEWDTVHHRRPAIAIARFADTRTSGLIAVTTHGQGGYRRVVMGSVALDLAHRSPVPVLALRPVQR